MEMDNYGVDTPTLGVKNLSLKSQMSKEPIKKNNSDDNHTIVKRKLNPKEETKSR